MIPFSLDSLFTQFIRERQFVKNASINAFR